MKPFAVALCLLVTLALLAYYGIRPLSIARPPPAPRISVVPSPGVSVNSESAPIPPQQEQLDIVKVQGVPAASEHTWGQPTQSENCKTIDGLPDSNCTPGDIDHSETWDIICSHDFHTGSVRDKTTTRTQKNRVYSMYAIAHPSNNTGRDQVCEIDHLVALDLGGSDTMAN